MGEQIRGKEGDGYDGVECRERELAKSSLEGAGEERRWRWEVKGGAI